MKKCEILKKLKEDLICCEYRLKNSQSRCLSPYQLEVLEHYGISYSKSNEPIYDCKECYGEIKHYAKLLSIYENKEL